MIVIRTAFVFSGQGAQYTGMGKELYDNFRICKDIFDEADSALSMHISKICFDEDKADALNNTEYCQPAILTLSAACHRLLQDAGIKAGIMAGLSLGEYSALTCAGAFRFSEAVSLVRQRGKFMVEAVPEGVGAMSAILGMPTDTLEQVCTEVQEAGHGYVICANYNAPEQTVIAGELNAVAEAEKLALSYGARRAVRLNVGGPFHTALLSPVADRMADELDRMTIGEMSAKVVSNTDAQAIQSKDDIKPTLLKQIVSPVRWEESVRHMIAEGVDTFIEVGPGKTLSAFIKKISRDVKTYHIENIRTYEKVLSRCQ